MKPIKSRKLPIMTLRFLLVLVAISLFGSRVHAMPEMYFVHSDHLGTPQVLTDKNQEVVWERSHTPFGETVEQSGTVIQPLRFPGQYEDTETGLYYNYYRDYDPMLGRFIQSDPIGKRGGLNPYSYVSNRPLMFVDPNGLFQQGGVAESFGFSQIQLDQIGKAPAMAEQVINSSPLVNPVNAYGHAYVLSTKVVAFVNPVSRLAQLGAAGAFLYDACTADNEQELLDVGLGQIAGILIPLKIGGLTPEVPKQTRERIGLAAGEVMGWQDEQDW